MWLNATHSSYEDIEPIVPLLSLTSQLHVLFPLLLVNPPVGHDQVPTWLRKGYQRGYGNVLLVYET